MNLSAFLCRFLKHRTEILDDWSEVAELRCSRCGIVLSTIAQELKPIGKSWDRSFTRGCMGKKRFASYQEATKRMDRMKIRPATLHPYHCPHCNGYHLGNRKSRR